MDVDNNGYLIRKGDVITSIDGNKIEKLTDIIKQMEKKKAGDLLDVIINRNGAIFHKSIMLQPNTPVVNRANQVLTNHLSNSKYDKTRDENS